MPLSSAEKTARYRQRRRAEVAAMPTIPCACGCGQQIAPINKKGRTARFAHGHNPSGEETRFKTGQTAWNKGKPAPWAVLAHTGKKLSADEIARRTAARRASDGYASPNRDRPGVRQRQGGKSWGIEGFRPDLGISVRSRWEANYARYLRRLGRSFQYEPHQFIVKLPDGSEHAYRPDFLVDGAYYVEVKGWGNGRQSSPAVLTAAETQLPLPLHVVRAAQYRRIEEQVAHEIPEWEYRGSERPGEPKRLCQTCGTVILVQPKRPKKYCSRPCQPPPWLGKKIPPDVIARRLETRRRNREQAERDP